MGVSQESPNTLIKRVIALAAAEGITVSPSRVSRLVRRRLKADMTDGQIIRFLRAYRDPTGDEAVRRVMNHG